MVEFTDEDGLRAWLKEQPRAVGEVIAARASLRVVPNLVGYFLPDWEVEDRPGLILAHFRCSLVSAVAAFGPTAETETELRSASAARSATFSATFSAASAASAFSADSVASAASAFSADSVASAASAAASARSAAFSAASASAAFSADSSASASAAWKAVSADGTQMWEGVDVADLFEKPVWPDGWMPDGYEENWVHLKRHLVASGGDWTFWISFFERCFSGGAHNWEMLREVALIPDAEWDGGPARMLPVISYIRQKYLLAASSLAEEVQFNSETGKFEVRPIEVSDAELFESGFNRLLDAAEDLEGDPRKENLARAMGDELRDIDRLARRYRADFQRVHDDCVAVAGRIEALIESGEIGDDLAARKVQSAASLVATDLRATNERVRKAVGQRAALRLSELSEEERARLERDGRVFADVSEEALAEQILEDILAVVTLDAKPGAPANPLPPVMPIYRLGSRFSRMAQYARENPGKTALGTGTVAVTVDGVISIFLRLFNV